MVDDVVGGEPHAEEGRGRVQVHRHARPRVHVLPDALQPGSLKIILGNGLVSGGNHATLHRDFRAT